MRLLVLCCIVTTIVLWSCSPKVVSSLSIDSDLDPLTALSAAEVIIEDTIVVSESSVSMTANMDEHPQNEKASSYRSSKTRMVDLTHTILDVRFDFQKEHLLGKAMLRLKPYFYPIDEVEIDAKGMVIKSITLGGATTKPLAYDYKDSMVLKVYLPRAYTRDEEFEINIDYVARPNQFDDDGASFFSSRKGLYFINGQGKDPDRPLQVWTQGASESSSIWFPTIDAPNERTTADIWISVPDTLTTLSNGVLIASGSDADNYRTDQWKMFQPHAPYLFMMAVGNFDVVNDEWQGKEVNYYMEPAFAPYAKEIFGVTKEALSFYSDRFGVPFPWDKYSQVVVRDFTAGAMENTTATILHEGLNTTSRELLDNNHDDIIVHELAHQWFGDLVTTESWANITLNEGFATYCEYLWFEHAKEDWYADEHLLNDVRRYMRQAGTAQYPLIRYKYNDRDEVFDRHSYQKGALVIHTLRKELGDEAFFEGLKRYLTQHAYKSVEVHDLRLVMEDVAGRDLKGFFDQWFFTAGHPELYYNVDYDSVAQQTTVAFTQSHSASDDFIYDLPVQYHYQQGGKQYSGQLELKSRFDTILITNKVDCFFLDELSIPLVDVKTTKTTSEWLAIQKMATDFRNQKMALLALSSEKEQTIEIKESFKQALTHSYAGMRLFALQCLPSANSLVFSDQIAGMSMQDKDAGVRLEALNYLASVNSAELTKSLLQILVKDSSYRVQSQALYYMFLKDSAAGVAQARQYDQTKNSLLTFTVAEILASSGARQDHSFFALRLNNLVAEEKQLMLDYYKRYLEAVNISSLTRAGIKNIQQVALNDYHWESRWAAFQTLEAFQEDLSGAKISMATDNEVTATWVKSLLDEVKASEGHSKLKKLMGI